MTATIRFIGSGDSFGSGGRFQTCILIDAAGTRFTMDFGTSSLIALRQQDIDPNSIDVILLTHLHGDHCGGVPFLLVDAMLGSKRDRPLTVAGPRDLRYRMFLIAEALFPGMHVMKPRFGLEWIELEPGVPTPVGDILVTARAVKHTWQTNPTALRAEIGGKVICYTGDGEFGEEMALAARGADLLVSECYYYEKPVRWHLNYPEVVAHKEDFGGEAHHPHPHEPRDARPRGRGPGGMRVRRDGGGDLNAVDVIPAKPVLAKAGSGNPYGLHRTRMRERAAGARGAGTASGEGSGHCVTCSATDPAAGPPARRCRPRCCRDGARAAGGPGAPTPRCRVPRTPPRARPRRPMAA